MFTLALGWSIKTHILIVILINRCQWASFFPLSFIRRYKFNLFYNMNMHRKRKRCILTENGGNRLKMCYPGSARPFGTKKHQLCPKNTQKKSQGRCPRAPTGACAPRTLRTNVWVFRNFQHNFFWQNFAKKVLCIYTGFFTCVQKTHFVTCSFWKLLTKQSCISKQESGSIKAALLTMYSNKMQA